MRNNIFLQGFDFENPAILETDASDVAYASIILQKDLYGYYRQVLIFSRTFTPE